MSSEPLLSIIIVVKNGEKTIGRTIESITAQSFRNFEIIVIDGASSDKTLEVVNKYKRHIAMIVSEPDRSHFDAMNKGLRLAAGEYVLFLHAGDELYNSRVLENMFSTVKGADAYYGDAIRVDSRGVELGLFRGKKAPLKLTWRTMRFGPAVNHQAFVIRRRLAAEYDFESYPICADTAWIINCLKKCSTIVNTRQVFCKSLVGGISDKFEYKTWLEHYRIYNRNFGAIQNLVNHFFMVPNYLLYKLFGRRF